MRTTATIYTRRFPVTIRDGRTAVSYTHLLLDDIAHQAGKLGHLDPVDGGAIDENLAFVNGVELVERFQQGRFPASAGTDQDKKLVVLDGQTDVHQYRFSAV